MLTLRRFDALVDSYGAHLGRWPQELRSDAQALLSVSSQARALLAEARVLDDVIAAAGSSAGSMRWPPGEQELALVRLRAGVAARIAAAAPPQPARRRFAWWSAAVGLHIVSPRLRLLGLATGGAFAVIAGLAIGTRYESANAPASQGVLVSLLQPAALGILAD